MAKNNTGWKNWGDHPIIVTITLLISFIGIVVFITGKTTLPDIINGFPTTPPTSETKPVIAISTPSLTKSTISHGNLLFEEDFESGDSTGWVNVNDGEWSVWQDNGNWVYGVRDQPANFTQTIFLTKSEGWQNYSFETEVMFKSGPLEQIWLTARTGKDSQCAGYVFGGNRYNVQLFRYDQKATCTSKTLAEANNYRLYENRLYKIRLEVIDNQIHGYIDDELILSAEDSIYPRGGIALSAYEVEWAQFDNIHVYQIER